MANILILGAGMMGTAFAWPLVDAGHTVRLVGTHLDDAIIAALKSGEPHPKLKLAVPTGITPFASHELEVAARDVDAIVLGVSSAGVRWAGEKLRDVMRDDVPIGMISKGLAWNGRELVSLPDVLATVLSERGGATFAPVGVGGPCIAGELARRVDTCVVMTGRNARHVSALATLARGPYYRIFPSADVVGVEVSAALKNAFAMGVGFAAGLHERAGGAAGSVAMHNHEAAVFAEAAVEMARVVTLAGGHAESAAGLAGVGDLNVTCNGGRTGRFGRWLGLGLTLPDAILKMEGATLECLEILDVMAEAVAGWEAQGKLLPRELPLLRHLIGVAKGRPAHPVPFETFFGGPS